MRATLVVLALLFGACTHVPVVTAPSIDGPVAGWPHYGGDPGGQRFSPLTQIDKGNVGRLTIAWEYRTGDASTGDDAIPWTAFEATPIVVEDTMYLSTPFSRVIALDPETGTERWRFDPHADLRSPSDGLVHRGVALWTDAATYAGDVCHRRVFVASADAHLYALDATSGRPCAGFGDSGHVDLASGVARIGDRRGYSVTSPPAIAGDLVVVGSSIVDNERVDSPSGVVRAYDARTGTLRWGWDPVPEALAPTGAANAWAPISFDARRDLVFVPTGSASPDYYGAARPGDNAWANSVVALSAATGKPVWGFQLVHHDLWDYDTASQPVLATLRRDAVNMDVVIQGNKAGNLFVLDRETGQPVFGVEERRVPQSDVDGEKSSPTQPFPLLPPPLARQTLTAGDAWGPTERDRSACVSRMSYLRSEGMYTPPSVRGTLVFPGHMGGMNWSGGAFDPARQLFVTSVSNVAAEVHLVPRSRYESVERAARQGQDFGEIAPQFGAPYGLSRQVLASPSGLPCNPPPWGSLVAVDLRSGKIRWNVPLGTTAYRPSLIPAVDGTPNLGGPMVTASGLVFIAAAMDDYLRAYDIDTGEELWRAHLPAGGQAAPMTYRVRRDGRQFVVIAAGGHAKLGTRLGDSVVAFALP